MPSFLWRIFKLGIVMTGLLGLLPGWYTLTYAAGSVPILLVVNDAASNKFGPYLGEILRAEGLNAFEVMQLSSVTATDLSNHELTILAETSLSSSQATLFSDYVNNGGRLLAMRAAQIAGLFGLGTSAGTLNNGYVKIDNNVLLNGEAPGQGLASATLQIHGTADQYTAAVGTVMLAQLYSSASSSTAYPAVISNQTGRAIAFTYDLVRNVVYTRQGNPANGNIDVDGDGILRTIDLFQGSGGGAPWVDRDKIAIPQADEQQRLFARLVKQIVGEVRPLPQLWYFPRTAKTMLILTADAHANPTSYYQNEINSLNAHKGKMTFYLSIAGDPVESQPGSNNDVLDWIGQGHTFGIHPYKFYPHPDYPPQDIENLADGYDTYDQWFGLQYPKTPKSWTTRNHQVAWQGWTDAAEIAESRGYRLNTDYYHWGAWLKTTDNSWPHGYITGSGQPMKFIRADGRIIDLYQQLTQLVDEQLIMVYQGYEWNENLSTEQAINVSKQLIDASQAGYYAALTTQFHVDYYGAAQGWAEGTLDYANSQGVPIWNADQWLSFTETRHDAEFTDIVWNDATDQLSFNLRALTNSNTISILLPQTYKGLSFNSVLVDGAPTSNTTFIVSGRQLVQVNVGAGHHSFNVSYGLDTTPPAVLVVSPGDNSTNASTNSDMVVTFSEPLSSTTINSSTFVLQDAANNFVEATVSYDSATNSATLTSLAELANSTSYTATVKGGSKGVKDVAGNVLENDKVWSFTTIAPSAGMNCQACTIWSDTATPLQPGVTDSQPIEVGVKFRSDESGYITGIRFYKAAVDTGAHVGHLWSSSGEKLAEAIFTGESSSGWQEVQFATPVAISANTTYIASYYSDQGYFSQDASYFATSAADNPPLHALASGLDGPNGVYLYGTGGGFPTNGGSNNYWVDVVFSKR